MLNVLNCTSKKRFPDGATFFSSEALIFVVTNADKMQKAALSEFSGSVPGGIY